ncbi:MAG TPA: hypothetical protein VKN99_04810 [Polyangia bacterium]|nr:hypothetical protein [Polyangia bacterium]
MRCAIASWLLLLVGACDASTETRPLPPSKLRAVATAPLTLELQLEGQRHLRGFQVTLDYDPAAVQILHAEPGPDAQWLDTVRTGGPAGHTVLLVSDTRQISLPRAGSIVRVMFSGNGHIALSHPLAADHSGAAPLEVP